MICNMDLVSLSVRLLILRAPKVITLLESMQHVIEKFSGFGTDDLYLLELDSKERESLLRL